MQTMSATYSPDDNKLRLYAVSRLSPELYARVKAAGFSWAPKQELFVAPSWSPGREDLLIELCGEIGDEDTSLADRAAERAERFDEYSENRAADAGRAHQAVAAIADNIPFGQPILVGHHSERHARKDAERIENGMRRAVKMWETSKYWTQRAAAAVDHAQYKERPDVRARRIKKIEADLRRVEKSKAESVMWLRLWELKPEKLKSKETGEPATMLQQALYWANRCHLGVTPNESGGYWTAYDVLQPDGERYKACPSWTPEQVREAARRCYPRSIAKCDRWIEHYQNRLAYERAMLGESGGTVADRTGPEKGGACKCWASPHGGWSYIQKVNKVSVTVLDNWGNGGRNFTRTIPFDKLARIVTAAEVQAARDAGTLQETDDATGFFLMESREQFDAAETSAPPETKPGGAVFDAMRDSLRAGVQTVTVPQLFQTPRALAARMVEIAAIKPYHEVLEPSAGTGAILDAIGTLSNSVCAVEINPALAQHIANNYPHTINVQGDFLNFNGDLGKFDRILMNPPFADGQDIAHIKHALGFLKPGGRLVAVCANGPRQAAKLRPLVELHAGDWEDLPADTFKESGTGVTAALLTFYV